MSLVEKFRPQKFSEIVGQTAEVAQIQAELSKPDPSRAYIISGVFGVGKTSLARLMAKYMNCQTRLPSAEPCCICSSCVAIAKGSAPDIIEINTSEARSIDDVRSWIANSMFAPRMRNRVYILDEFQGLQKMAQEAFLKSLEEPPRNTCFIICTTAVERIIQPIRSRCQSVNLQLVEKEVMVPYLLDLANKAEIKLDQQVAEMIADKTSGHMRDAVQALQVVLNLLSSGQRISEDKILQYIENYVEVAPERLVQKFLLGLYTKNYTAAFRVAKAIPNPDYFLSTAIEFHMQALFACVNFDKLVDSRYKEFVGLIAQLPTKQKMSRILTILTETAAEARTHLTDSRSVLVNCACKALQAVEE